VTPIQKKRAELEAEKAALLVKFDVIQGKLELLDEIEPQVPALPVAVSTVPAKPRPAAAPRAVAGTPADRVTGHSATARRLMVARLVADKGPLRNSDVAKELGLNEQSSYHVLGHEWFAKGDDKRYSLTDAGRAALAESARGPGE